MWHTARSKERMYLQFTSRLMEHFADSRMPLKSINYIKRAPKNLKLTSLKASCWRTIPLKCSSLSKASDSWPRPISLPHNGRNGGWKGRSFGGERKIRIHCLLIAAGSEKRETFGCLLIDLGTFPTVFLAFLPFPLLHI